jgi:uncharacterized protein
MKSIEVKISENLKEKLLNFYKKDEVTVFLFGSRASGEHRERSDIDIGIEHEKGTAIPLEIMSELLDVCEDFPTLLKIDLVDFAKVSNDFKEVAYLSRKIL